MFVFFVCFSRSFVIITNAVNEMQFNITTLQHTALGETKGYFPNRCNVYENINVQCFKALSFVLLFLVDRMAVVIV